MSSLLYKKNDFLYFSCVQGTYQHNRTMTLRTSVLIVVTVSLVACSTPVYEGLQPTMKTRFPQTHMDESLRREIETVVVIPHTQRAEMMLFGTYEAPQASPSLMGIWTARHVISFSIENITSDAPGALPIEFLLPYLVLPVFLYGMTKQLIKNQIQEFRDNLTEQLERSAGQPVSNMQMAHDLYSAMRKVPGLDVNVIAENTPLPEGTDAVLLIRLTDITVEILKDVATTRSDASAILRRVSDGHVLYRREYFYEDSDTLRSWNRNEAALWVDYMNYARHYIARQVTADFFEKIELRHDLYPIPTDTAPRQRDDNWRADSIVEAPTLAWKLVLLGRDLYPPWAVSFNENHTWYDLEIYDDHRLVYSAMNIAEPRHQVTKPLSNCKDLRWTVRPSYRSGATIKYGEWMRYHTSVELDEGYVGTKASETPAFTRGFAVLATSCR